MSRREEHLDPDRLVAAAEAALRAAVDVADYTGGPWPYPADLMGTPLQPEFLVRLGALDKPLPRKAA